MFFETATLFEVLLSYCFLFLSIYELKRVLNIDADRKLRSLALVLKKSKGTEDHEEFVQIARAETGYVAYNLTGIIYWICLIMMICTIKPLYICSSLAIIFASIIGRNNNKRMDMLDAVLSTILWTCLFINSIL